MQCVTQKQSQALWSNYRFLSETGAVSPEEIGRSLTQLCPGLDETAARQGMERLTGGMERFRQACAASREQAGDARETVRSALQGLSEQQRKGLYLQCCEFLQASDAQQTPAAQQAESAAELSGQPEQALLDRLTEQLEIFSQQLAAQALSDAGEPVDVEDPVDPLLLAAAAYAAGVNGDLPESFQQHPELIGVCCAARETLTRELSEVEGDAESLKEQVLTVLGTVLFIVAFTVLVLGLSLLAGTAAAAAMDLVLSLGTATAHHLLAPILDICLFGLATAAGVAVALGVLALPGLGIWLTEEGWKKAADFYRRHSAGTTKAHITRQDPAEQEEERRENAAYTARA